MEQYVRDCMKCFPGSFINYNNELILIKKTNLYICLDGVKNRQELIAKLIEWCSRDAHKTQPFDSEKKNNQYHESVRLSLNLFFGKDYTEDDYEELYINHGNAINHPRTLEFVAEEFGVKC